MLALIIARMSQLPWWAQLLIGLCAFAALLFVAGFLIVLRRVVIADNSASAVPDKGDNSATDASTEPTLSASGHAKAVQSSKVGRDVVFGDAHYHGSDKPTDSQPQISLRILSVEVRRQPPRTISKTGSVLGIDVSSLLTVVFSALNSNACQTSLDGHLLEVTMPSGERLDCRDVTHLGGIGMELSVPNPPGVQRLEMNAPLSKGNTIRRFARFLVTEIVKLEDPQPVGGFPNPLIFERLVFQARDEVGAYEKIGTLLLTITDSYGIDWHAQWIGGHPMPPVQERLK